MASREKLCGGAPPGAIAPVTTQGPCWRGRLLTSGSLANARRRSVEADLKTYMRMAFLCPSSSGCDRYRIEGPRAWAAATMVRADGASRWCDKRKGLNRIRLVVTEILGHHKVKSSRHVARRCMARFRCASRARCPVHEPRLEIRRDQLVGTFAGAHVNLHGGCVYQ